MTLSEINLTILLESWNSRICKHSLLFYLSNIHFQKDFPEDFGPTYDKALLILIWTFLSRLEKLLTLKTFQEVYTCSLYLRIKLYLLNVNVCSSECFFFSGFIHVSGGLKCSGEMRTFCITRAAQTPAALSERSQSPGSQWQATVYTIIPC